MRSSEYAMPVDAERFATLDNPETLLLGFEPTGERYTLAARIQGPPRRHSPMVSKAREGHPESQNINVIAVADTDMLADRMWVQVQDFSVSACPSPGPTTAPS